jgi:hypothetical protein
MDISKKKKLAMMCNGALLYTLLLKLKDSTRSIFFMHGTSWFNSELIIITI